MTAVLEARGVRQRYHLGETSIEALRGVDFSVERGEFVAIMGPSGSGKSTLLHLLGGLDTPSGGDVILNGRSLRQMDDDTLTITRRQQIGFVFQFFNLVPTLSAAENVALPLLMDGQPLASAQERIDHLLALVGLSERRDHKPHQLSGGQQQRVAIARALVTQPQMVLADEPTGNLDSAAGGAILQLLRRARDEQGQTIVMVTHDNRAAACADRVVFLQDGQIVRVLAPQTGRDKGRTQEIAAAAARLGL